VETVTSSASATIAPATQNPAGVFGATIPSVASLLQADVTLALVSRDGSCLETISCKKSDYNMQQRQLPVARDVADFFSHLTTASRVVQTPRESKTLVTLGARVGTGFLLYPIVSLQRSSAIVRGSLGVAYTTVYGFQPPIERALSVVCGLCEIAIATEEPIELLGPRYFSSESRRPWSASGRQLILSLREWEIGELLSEDYTCKEIAEKMGLSRRTVEHYIERLKLRLGSSTIHGLISSLIRQGLCRGFHHPLYGLVLDDSWPSRRTAQRLGAKNRTTQTTYRKTL
jgi:DNA-binding CsgD family transcriptional regulator